MDFLSALALTMATTMPSETGEGGSIAGSNNQKKDHPVGGLGGDGEVYRERAKVKPKQITVAAKVMQA